MLSTLIVEDNVAHRQSLHHLLEGRFPSMRIAEAADGEEALHQALNRRFDLIFMDIRLPQGNGLNLTKTIKAIFVDSVICIITSNDILEYREAAFRNGADHFMVKGESTEAEIVGLVDALLRTRFTTLILVNDALYRRQLNMLLSIRWPTMIIAEASNAATGLTYAAALKPDLVLLELGLPERGGADLVNGIRALCPQAALIGMTCDAALAGRATAVERGVDHCVPLTPMGHTELVTILNSLQPEYRAADSPPDFRDSGSRIRD
jgi:DNA-binding NarL/FixJ family response regulator